MIKQQYNQDIPLVIHINLSYIYDIYRIIYPLTCFQGSIERKLIFKDIWRAYEMLLSINDLYQFKSAYNSIENLKTILDTQLQNFNTDNINESINISEAQKISSSALALEMALRNELSIQPAYLVTPKGGYDVDVLTLSPEKAFPEGLIEKAPETKYDVRECARALAFELPTACGFHLMRIFEAILKRYYLVIVENGDLNKEEKRTKTIGELITEIIATKTSEIGDILKSIKDNYRNPLVHLEINMDMKSALGLFGVVCGAINFMLEKIEEPSPVY